jgi:hypothetical protein
MVDDDTLVPRTNIFPQTALVRRPLHPPCLWSTQLLEAATGVTGIEETTAAIAASSVSSTRTAFSSFFWP